MVKFGYSSVTNEHIYYVYVCDHCGNSLGAIEIIYGDKHTEERDDIVGWKFCPYCGENLWNEEPWLE